MNKPIEKLEDNLAPEGNFTPEVSILCSPYRLYSSTSKERPVKLGVLHSLRLG
ncbi:hypothetical protein HBI56_225430 [Parastagonospora nodorum]|uniref:Uncharacterized protein n=1 Tax=Phaeosphaeria nodorum (strain SN15 / ATCC MYA-4574 / FGSC 10173) TaxID=321614 RepID=A0A7U2NRD7_PHANO|nr:hypothetical protein HBH56_239050 [Parastagonospora nodorum]QRD07621.1 hypothetical protein JI435_447790 [Parastagonospora nodorum SN15]KAH3921655.1 hypothetical protein HBH54_236990 [Parastagonospora nodorum]KAH3939774.1 hypothetical protein HBH53_228910 [Parastagonospora nodorum]KAH3957899.1 hypothetical protein HBH51_217460 [Parastagonospora nodorum]